jgi:hypothetical protein
VDTQGDPRLANRVEEVVPQGAAQVGQQFRLAPAAELFLAVEHLGQGLLHQVFRVELAAQGGRQQHARQQRQVVPMAFQRFHGRFPVGRHGCLQESPAGAAGKSGARRRRFSLRRCLRRRRDLIVAASYPPTRRRTAAAPGQNHLGPARGQELAIG